MRNSKTSEPTQRQLRVGEQIRHILAETMQRGHFNEAVLIDAHLSISEVKLSPDLKHATAYVMALGGVNMDEILPALNKDRNVFKKEIARNAGLRFTPTIRFVADNSFNEAEKIENILREIHAEKE
ncbi:MAG TPA: 30S ribosome-binding factor RbfA [Alphaproteobacteria bacterium]|jgi:ribosome-binding factor A|nr:30S ribosome-binding factor RbfA [Micavibrio sp.]MBK9563090.1 30S ribosome-binding factor RbfA [Micavibrio sp.]HQX27021.1 30S ribosome-binding factor RbfA [Alphaproteobacteria bacterium]